MNRPWSTDESTRSPDTTVRADRRHFLASTCAVGAALVAGCSGDGNGDADTGDGNGDGDTATGDDDGNGDADTGDGDGNGDADGGDGDGDRDSEGSDDGDGDGNQADTDPAEVEATAREFIQLLLAESFDEAYERASPEYEQEVPQAELTQLWQETIPPLGEFVEFTTIEYQGEQQGVDVVEAEGQFARGSVDFTVAVDGETIAGFVFEASETTEWLPPEYVDQSAFTEEQLSLTAPGDCELGATLTLPEGDQPVPSVVLVHGSGDQNRDQRVGPNRTFKELAWGLATRGVAVLRYDQRPFACDVDRTAATVDDLITDDALTALDRLRAREEVGSVFVAGHSLGGRLAPRVADRDGNVAGVVMLAPLAEPVSDAIVRQTRHQLERNEQLTESEREQRLADVQALAERIRTLDIAADELIDLGGGDRGRPFFRTLQEYDHVETAANLDLPLLIAQGERDSLVTVEDDLPIWEAALGDDPAVRITRYESLNHRFQPGEGPGRPAEWFEPNPVAEQVVDDVATFVLDAGE